MDGTGSLRDAEILFWRDWAPLQMLISFYGGDWVRPLKIGLAVSFEGHRFFFGRIKNIFLAWDSFVQTILSFFLDRHVDGMVPSSEMRTGWFFQWPQEVMSMSRWL